MVVVDIKRVVPNLLECGLRQAREVTDQVVTGFVSFSRNDFDLGARLQPDWFIQHNILAIEMRVERSHPLTLTFSDIFSSAMILSVVGKIWKRSKIDRYPHLRFVFCMQMISSADARERLDSLLDEVVREREPIAITRTGEGSVVLLPAEEFAAMEETLYLLSTSANAERIRQGVADFGAGKLLPGDVCD